MIWPPDPLALVMLLLCLALQAWPAPGTGARNRLHLLTTQADLARQSGGSRTRAAPGGASDGGWELRADGAPARRTVVFAGLAGSAVLATVPSVVGGLIAVAVAAGCYVILREISLTKGPGHGAPDRLARLRWLGGGRSARVKDADRTLPFAIDLLAVCLRAGMPTSSAMRSVASTLSGTTPGRPERGVAPKSGMPGVCVVLARVAAASELGSEPAMAWEEWISHPSYGPLARALVVTGESGSAVASRLEAVSRQLRVASGQQAMVHAQRAGVALMAPLGLCFLPAFVCLGVVPVVVGLAGQVLG